ncbi:MAG: hypothetical protein HC886_10815 [Leptolyngbyaceae cyanobacterium SM1_1_3]|nr:hypothetical protein [Leptolyngbyaceae cyanobacterium SM1_1_3]
MQSTETEAATESALAEYARVIDTADPVNQIRARLNVLSLLIKRNRFSEATAAAREIQAQLAALPPDQDTLESQIHFIYDLLTWKGASSLAPGDDLLFSQLAIAREQALKLNNKRSIAYVTGAFGQAYALNLDFAQAKASTEAALFWLGLSMPKISPTAGTPS